MLLERFTSSRVDAETLVLWPHVVPLQISPSLIPDLSYPTLLNRFWNPKQVGHVI